MKEDPNLTIIGNENTFREYIEYELAAGARVTTCDGTRLDRPDDVIDAIREDHHVHVDTTRRKEGRA
jgi:hypothetical protein